MDNYYNPYGELPEIPGCEQMSDDERECVARVQVLCWCLTPLVSAVIGVLLCLLLCGCSTARTSTTERHVATVDIEIIDSLLRHRSVVQHDSAWHEHVLRQFESIRERSDTSRVVVQDTAGNVVKETIIIHNTREATSAAYERDREVLLRSLSVLDSTIRTQRASITRMDSLLRERQEVRTVSPKLSWWQRVRLHVGGVVVFAAVIAVGLWLWGRLR